MPTPISKEFLKDYWATFVTLANDTPPPSVTTAREHLQAAADQVSDADADAFFLEVSQVYQDLGLTSQNTYVSLRNEINQAGETASNKVFSISIAEIRSTVLGSLVAADLFRASSQAEFDATPNKVTIVETDRDLKSDQVLIDAYNDGIAALNKRAEDLLNVKGVTDEI